MPRVAIYAIDANPAIDPPMIHKSESYARSLVASGQAFELASTGKPRIQLCSRQSAQDDTTLIVRNAQGSISHREVVLNACYSIHDSPRARMAHVKVKLWNRVGDDHAPRIISA